MNYLEQNIRHLRKKQNLTQDDLAKKIGVNRSMVGSYEEGRAAPKITVLQVLASYFRVTLDELINIDIKEAGKFNEGGSSELDLKGRSLRILTTIVNDDNIERITAVPVKAKAGYLNGYSDPDFIENLPSFNIPLPELANDRSYRAFQIDGDSMDPVPSGSYVIGEYVQNWQDIKSGSTYILLTETEGVVYKRLVNNIDETGKLICHSDNPAYEPFEIGIKEVTEVWKANGYISFNLPENDQMSISKLTSLVYNLQQKVDGLAKK